MKLNRIAISPLIALTISKIKTAGWASLVALGLGSAPAAAAPVVWDYSPDTAPLEPTAGWTNTSAGPNWIDRFTLSATTLLTGMAIYSLDSFGDVGDATTVRVYADAAGAPGSKIHEFEESISVIDNEGATLDPGINRKFADFTLPLLLSAGTYYIGMSGIDTEISQQSILNIDDSNMWLLSGDTVSTLWEGFGDMSFRLYGTSVPAPGAALLLIVGLAGLGLHRRS